MNLSFSDKFLGHTGWWCILYAFLFFVTRYFFIGDFVFNFQIIERE